MNKRRRKKSNCTVYIVHDVDGADRPTIFGVFDTEAAANKAVQLLRRKRPTRHHEAEAEAFTLNRCDALDGPNDTSDVRGPWVRSDVHVSASFGPVLRNAYQLDDCQFLSPSIFPRGAR